ncbi:hypothetical protein P7H59_00590 [Enterococcus viikkiensis]|uniref:Uncharacterized protein n=1 Tax=Enterococcus viikkiensis TaxID=930854 RepID=A0ABU3FLU6_9ENTE|nr:hypothetical protein [Enterococcus viikkiensis]MDT2826945.1 hypothetical protein [Enterococcus viikkiensis]
MKRVLDFIQANKLLSILLFLTIISCLVGRFSAGGRLLGSVLIIVAANLGGIFFFFIH